MEPQQQHTQQRIINPAHVAHINAHSTQQNNICIIKSVKGVVHSANNHVIGHIPTSTSLTE